jgi:hypothetical protein
MQIVSNVSRNSLTNKFTHGKNVIITLSHDTSPVLGSKEDRVLVCSRGTGSQPNNTYRPYIYDLIN